MDSREPATQDSRDIISDRLIGGIYTHGQQSQPIEDAEMVPIPITDMKAILDLQNFSEISIKGPVGKMIRENNKRASFSKARNSNSQSLMTKMDSSSN